MLGVILTIEFKLFEALFISYLYSIAHYFTLVKRSVCNLSAEEGKRINDII